MKTADAIRQAGTAKALAELLKITPSAISQWGDEVPDSRVWQLRVLRPAWFDEPAGEVSAVAGEGASVQTAEGEQEQCMPAVSAAATETR